MAERGTGGNTGGIGLGGVLVIVGIVLMIVWSFWLGLIIALVGLIAFGGFAKGKWYSAAQQHGGRGPSRRDTRSERGAERAHWARVHGHRAHDPSSHGQQDRGAAAAVSEHRRRQERPAPDGRGDAVPGGRGLLADRRLEGRCGEPPVLVLQPRRAPRRGRGGVRGSQDAGDAADADR